MFANWWHKKERPLLGLVGMGGGVAGGGAAALGKFTVNGGSERPIADGHSTPVSIGGGSEFYITVTAGPFTGQVKLWGAGGGCGWEGGIAGCGGFTQGDIDFQLGETYRFVVGSGGRRNNQGGSTYGGGGAARSGYNGGGAGYMANAAGGGGGYTGMFKAPPTVGGTDWRTQSYAVLIAGGGGGAGTGSGECGNTSGQQGGQNYRLPRKGGPGGGAYAPVAPPFATNYGGGRYGSTAANDYSPTVTNPSGQTTYWPWKGSQSGYGGAGNGPKSSGPPYGGERGGYFHPNNPPTRGHGAALEGGDAAQGNNNGFGGGAGGGGGYWGGGGSGNPNNVTGLAAGGGGGVATHPDIHPEGIEVTNIDGASGWMNKQIEGPNGSHPGQGWVSKVPTWNPNNRESPNWNPLVNGANWGDPDWVTNAGRAAIYGGPNYDGPYSDPNAMGYAGAVVIKAP